MPLTQQRLNGFRVDFFWPDLKLVVETDGLRYHRTPSQQARDRLRDQAHLAAGFTPLRFTHAQVRFEAGYVRFTLLAVVNRLRRLGGDLSLGRDGELPSRVRIREVGPRDGFQNEPETIPTADKVRLIDMLSASGVEAARGDLVRAARRDPAALRRGGGAGGGAAARRRLLLGPDPERARAGAGAWRCASASTRSTSSSPPRRPTTARTSTARSRSRWPGWSGRWRARARRGCAARG